MLNIFAARWLWSAPIRILLFWAIVVAGTWKGYSVLAPLGANEAASVVVDAFHGDLTRVSTQSFAFSLAVGIGTSALALLIAYFLLDAVLVRLAIFSARRLIQRPASKAAFADGYEDIYRRMIRHPLLGHAWSVFDDTLIKANGAIKSTVRPQALFGYSALREKLAGLKIMPSVPGYFVGVGLLFTFIGLVIALSKAAAGTEAARGAAGGAGAAAMQDALRELLQAATFKFSTSIAGLAASIALSFFFKLFVVSNESSLAGFCEALERKLDYVAPQSVTLTMVEKLDAQLTELKAINSEDFISRLGQGVAPAINTALHGAFAPLSDRIGEAIGQLTANSQSGVEELLKRFTESVNAGAGTELRELGVSLQAMHGVLEKVRADMSGSGEEFARRMTDTAETLTRLVREAQTHSVEGISAASAHAAAALEQGLAQAMEKIRMEVESFAAALRGSSTSLDVQTKAMDNYSSRSREAAAEFSRSADAIRNAVEPVTRSNEKLASVTQTIGESMVSSVAALADSQKAAATLADTIANQLSALNAIWGEYEKRFGKVDEDLGRAFEKLASETKAQSQLLAEQSAKIDSGLATAIDKLSPFLQELGDGAGDLAEAVDELKALLTKAVAGVRA